MLKKIQTKFSQLAFAIECFMINQSPERLAKIKEDEKTTLKYLPIEEKVQRLYIIQKIHPSIAEELFDVCLEVHYDDIGKNNFLYESFQNPDFKIGKTPEETYRNAQKAPSLWTLKNDDFWEKYIDVIIQRENKSHRIYWSAVAPHDVILPILKFDDCLSHQLEIMKDRNISVDIELFNAQMNQCDKDLKYLERNSDSILNFFQHKEVSSFFYINKIPYGTLKTESIEKLLVDIDKILSDFFDKNNRKKDSFLKLLYPLLTNIIEHINAAPNTKELWDMIGHKFWGKQKNMNVFLHIVFDRHFVKSAEELAKSRAPTNAASMRDYFETRAEFGRYATSTPVELILVKKLIRTVPYSMVVATKNDYPDMVDSLLLKNLSTSEFEHVQLMLSLGQNDDCPLLEKGSRTQVQEMDNIVISF